MHCGKIIILLRQYMESFFLCWMFDNRWLFGLKNPCLEFVLIVPSVVNLATIIGIVYERNSLKIGEDSYSILMYILCGLQIILCLSLMLRTCFVSSRKLSSLQENYQAIRHFIYTFQAKKGIWSWNGGLIFLLSILQITINSLYIKDSSQYECVTNHFRFYVDIVAWGYMCGVIVLFLMCKVGFLLFAWKNPEKYLSYKQVI